MFARETIATSLNLVTRWCLMKENPLLVLIQLGEITSAVTHAVIWYKSMNTSCDTTANKNVCWKTSFFFLDDVKRFFPWSPCGRKDRSRSPPRRGSLRMGGRVLPQTGGFTDKVGLVERTIVVTAIPFGADEKILFKHFSKCGLIEDLQMIYNKKGE